MRMRFLHLLLLASLLAALWPGATTAQAAPERIGTRAEAASLIDVASGRLLYSQQGEKRMRIASLTKIMTAIVAIEQGKLSDQVTVSGSAAGKEGSSVYLKAGEEISLQNLLYGLMLRSGNDAATAIAEHVGGSEQGFVYLMNEKAKELGMEGSHFMNPHGLDHEQHFSTANDMAKLTAYALKNPIFQEVVKTRVKRVPDPGESWDRVWSNKNKMLTLYEGSDGVKTGYTKLAKRCLVSSATRDGQQLAVVTLNDPDDWLDHKRLLDWGYKGFRLTTLIEKEAAVEPGFGAGRSFTYALADGEAAQINKKLEWNGENTAAYRLGEAGKLTFYLKGKIIGSVPVYPVGSPRFQAGDPSADQNAFMGRAAAVEGSREGWRNVFGAVLRALFTGEGRG